MIRDGYFVSDVSEDISRSTFRCENLKNNDLKIMQMLNLHANTNSVQQ